MRQTTKTRRETKSMGRLDPSAVYTAKGVMRAIGIGREQLRVARQTGIVKAYLCGGTAYYRGSEIIEYILSVRDADRD